MSNNQQPWLVPWGTRPDTEVVAPCHGKVQGQASICTTWCYHASHRQKCVHGDRCWHAHRAHEALRCPHAYSGACPSSAECQLSHAPPNVLLALTRKRNTATSNRSGGGVPRPDSSGPGQHTRRRVPFNAMTQGRQPDTQSILYVNDLDEYPLPRTLQCHVADSKEQMADKDFQTAMAQATSRHLRQVLPRGDTRLTRANFKQVLQAVVEVDEMVQQSEIRRYDQHDATMTLESSLWKITVPSLAEKRPSVLRGDFVHVHEHQRGTVHKGYVHFVNLDHVLCSFSTTNPPRGGMFDIFFMLSRTHWRQQQRAIRVANAMFLDTSMASNKITTRVRQNPDSVMRTVTAGLTGLQRKAVANLFETPRQLHLLWGPPGTGKTTTLVRSIIAVALANPQGRIAVVAPSNVAIDLVAQRMLKLVQTTCFTPKTAAALQSRMLRVHGMSRAVKDVGPDLLAISPEAKQGGFLFPTREQLSAEGRIIFCTCGTAPRIIGVGTAFVDWLFLDEAGQLTEAEVLMPLSLAQTKPPARVMLAGDHKQLGPVLQPALRNVTAAQSPFLRLMEEPAAAEAVEAVVMLVDNFRSHRNIIALFNPTYENRLVDRVTHALEHTQKFEEYVRRASSVLFPVAPTSLPRAVFVHVEGVETREEDSPSWMNKEELKMIRTLLKRINPDTSEDVAVLTPYRKQSLKLQKQVHDDVQKKLLAVKPRVASIELFQGQEAPVVLLSCVRSANTSEIASDVRRHLGFLKQPQRLNVALSRAQALLIIVGNAKTMQHDKEWNRVLRTIRVVSAPGGRAPPSFSSTAPPPPPPQPQSSRNDGWADGGGGLLDDETIFRRVE